MPEIDVPGVLAVNSGHSDLAEARDWWIKRYFVIVNPKTKEMGGMK